MNPSESGKTILPSGRPYLIDRRSASELLYLSWGTRRYGISPIPVTSHEGWVYMLVRAGAPRLLRRGPAPRQIRSGRLLVISPDCASGWTDRGRRQCEILTWVWKGPPRLAESKDAGFTIYALEKSAQERLAAIHELCREQVSRPDLQTPRTLRALRELIEAELDRSCVNHGPAVQPRMQFALAWLERHGHEPQPVSRLAEYLQISHSSLDRLFKKELRMSVSAWLHAKKMRRAETLVREQKLSRKEIAFELGYAHANDFSRAWFKWMQQTSKLRTGQ